MVLLKLEQKDHLEMLRAGLLYMNSLAHFKTLELDVARGDPYEGTDSIIQPCDIGEFLFDPHVDGIAPLNVHGAPDGLAGPVRIARNRTFACNVFCMFAVDKPIVGPIFPRPHEWPGDHFVLFTNTQEFLNRVVGAAKSQRLRVEGRRVEYYDGTKYSGQTGGFRKRSAYSYQCEYRIVVEAGVDGPFNFGIGDLSDITSEVISRGSADDALKLSPQDALEAGLSWG